MSSRALPRRLVKQREREQDARDLKSGVKTPDELRRENGYFNGKTAQVHFPSRKVTARQSRKK